MHYVDVVVYTQIVWFCVSSVYGRCGNRTVVWCIRIHSLSPSGFLPLWLATARSTGSRSRNICSMHTTTDIHHSLVACLMRGRCFVCTGRIEITRPKVKPVYVNSGGTLDLICELDYPYNLQWHRALFHSGASDGRRVYEKIDTSSVDGFFMTAQIIDGRGWTQLRKYNVSVADAGSYKCSRTNDPQTSYAVDVNVMQGKTPSTHIRSVSTYARTLLSP